MCEMCPGRENLVSFLTEHFENEGFDFDSPITFKQWETTDRTTLVCQQSQTDEFINNATSKLKNLC